MKEFESTFAKGLKKGLREDDENPRNQEALVECLNAKPSEEGLIPIVPVTTPMTVSMAWPFPQVFDRPLAASLCSTTTDVSYSGSDPLEVSPSSRVTLVVANGLGPFTWAATGTGISWATTTTDGRTNTLIIAATTADGTWTVTDVCGDEASGVITILRLCPGSVLDTLEFDTADCLTPMAVHIGGAYYAMVYQSSDGDGWLRTFSIDAAGAITAVDNWEFSTTYGADPLIYHISGNVYLITAGSVSTSYMYTVTISTAGVITKTAIDSEALTDAAWSVSTVVNITGTMYAVCWRTASEHCVSTYTITNAGVITLVDSYSFATSYYPTWSYLVAANVIMTVTYITDNKLVVTTYGISDAGAITDPYLDTQEITVTGSSYQRTWGVQVTSNIFATTLQSIDQGGQLSTFQVNDDGTIESSVIDEYQFTTALNSANAHILDLEKESAFLLSYQGADGDGYMQTVTITDAGIITARSACSALEFDTGHGLNPFALPKNGIFVPVFYAGPDIDGFLKTIEMA